ncbi:MAG: hypothetical protein HYZ45_10155 [Burkholderiales bacterium]|nr:hypothetical protein [Burkholderiales bacterium]
MKELMQQKKSAPSTGVTQRMTGATLVDNRPQLSVVQLADHRANSASAIHLADHRAAVVQRVLDAKQQQEFDELNQAEARPDLDLEERVKTLLRSVDKADKPQVGTLLKKFAGGVKAKKENEWEWNPQKVEAATHLEDASLEVLRRARQIADVTKGAVSLAPDPRDKTPLTTNTVVPLIEYKPGNKSGLGMWTGLLKMLKARPGVPTIHIISFQTVTGHTVQVTLSEHGSASAKDTPDYFVHDSRSVPYMNSQMGILPGAPGGPLAMDAEDTLDVNYVAFAQKIQLMKTTLGVNDAKIAEWMLMIIMSPSLAHGVILKEAPAIKKNQIDLMYELVTTWMLAEPARNKESNISGVMELELIEAGQRSFAQSLSKTDPKAHPMSHIGSESQGRDAEKGVRQDKPYNKVFGKQKQQLDDSYGDQARLGLIALVEFYTHACEAALE